jgi:chromosome segregation ATPase
LAKNPSAQTAPARGSDEFDALHAALDSRLAALEAALADPGECALEGLILDLARVATDEAEAVARRASHQARAEADAQAGNALSQAQIAEAALASERHAGLELHRSLGAARTELETARQKLSALTYELDQIRDAFNTERTSLRAELSEAERCFAAADTRRQQVEEARDEEVARERGTVKRLTDALAQARNEIDAARQDVASRAADMEAARERADIAGRSLADLTQSLNETRARLDSVEQERERLKTDLESARQGAATSAAAIQSAATERAGLEQKLHNADVRLKALGEERDRLTADRDAANARLESARQGAATAAAAAQAIETQRAALEQTLHEVEAHNDQGLRDVEARIEVIAREHHAIVAERDAALAARDKLVAERDAAQAKCDAAEADRKAAVAQLETARQGSSTANSAIQSLEAHQASLEQKWQSAEARVEALMRECDAAIAERDAAFSERDAAIAERAQAVASAEAIRQAVDDAQETERARFSELRQRTERQIQDLEAQLLGGADAAGEEGGPEIDVSLDDSEEGDAAIEIEAMEPDEPIVMAAKPKTGSRGAQAAPGTFSPSREASRHSFREPLEVKLDGETALLVDLSTAGAQVLSSTALKPNKPVKMLLPSSEAIILCKAKIIWSRFEPPSPGKPVRYRAGMVFTQADAAALHVFLTRHSGLKTAGAGAAPAPEDRKTGRLISAPFNSAAPAGRKTRRADSRDPIASIDFKFPARGRE